MAFRMFSAYPRHAVDFLPTRSNRVPHFAGMTDADRAAVMERRFGGNFSTQGDTEVRYGRAVSRRDTKT